MRFGEMLPQSTLMNGLSALRLMACMRWAITSLPTPVSPSMSTEMSVCAMMRALARKDSMAELKMKLVPSSTVCRLELLIRTMVFKRSR